MSERAMKLCVGDREETERMGALFQHVVDAGVKRIQIGDKVFELSQPEEEKAAAPAVGTLREEAEQTMVTLLKQMRTCSKNFRPINGYVDNIAKMTTAITPLLLGLQENRLTAGKEDAAVPTPLREDTEKAARALLHMVQGFAEDPNETLRGNGVLQGAAEMLQALLH